MNPENFIEAYQSALGKQEWNAVEPLIAKNAVVTLFSKKLENGSCWQST